MKQFLVVLLAAATLAPTLAPTLAQAGGMNTGRRLDAIASGRLYDPILTPQVNPGFHFTDPSAEAALLRDIRNGRVNLNAMPEAQRNYYLQRLQPGQ